MESTPEQVAEGKAVIKVLAYVLERLVSANSKIAELDPGVITRFHALKPPSITVLSYLERIHKYASCSTECFILALIYIDRLIQRNDFLLTELNVHRVAITSIMLAAKFFDDQYFNNAYYAKVGGVPSAEMNSLEVEFLFRINFSLHVTPELYNKYHSELVTHASNNGSHDVVKGLPSAPSATPMFPPSPPSVAQPSPYDPQEQEMSWQQQQQQAAWTQQQNMQNHAATFAPKMVASYVPSYGGVAGVPCTTMQGPFQTNGRGVVAGGAVA